MVRHISHISPAPDDAMMQHCKRLSVPQQASLCGADRTCTRPGCVTTVLLAVEDCLTVDAIVNLNVHTTAAASPFNDMEAVELDAVDVDALQRLIVRLENELDQVCGSCHTPAALCSGSCSCVVTFHFGDDGKAVTLAPLVIHDPKAQLYHIAGCAGAGRH